jgi:hypothetical protein
MTRESFYLNVRTFGRPPDRNQPLTRPSPDAASDPQFVSEVIEALGVTHHRVEQLLTARDIPNNANIICEVMEVIASFGESSGVVGAMPQLVQWMACFQLFDPKHRLE